jgi:hypothetical protein
VWHDLHACVPTNFADPARVTVAPAGRDARARPISVAPAHAPTATTATVAASTTRRRRAVPPLLGSDRGEAGGRRRFDFLPTFAAGRF